MRALRRDRAANTALIPVLIIAVVAIVLFAFLVNGMMSLGGGRRLVVTFVDATSQQPVAGVPAYVYHDGVRIASGTSGLSGVVTFSGLPAETVSWSYGGGPWVYHGEGDLISLVDGDKSVTRGVLPCPSADCGSP